MSRRLFAALLLAVTAASSAAAQNQQPHIHPRLAPLVQNPAAEIHPIVSGSAWARRGERLIQGQQTLDLFLRTTASRTALEALGVQVRTLRDGRATVTAPVSALSALAARPDVQLNTLPLPVRPQLERSVPETGANRLRSQSAGSFTGHTGAGVVVGVVDSGIDYDHPDFLDAAGNSRILYLWDQQTSGTAPGGYAYGNECTSAEIDADTCTEEDESSEMGHGTHVTGIAAGTGAAPDGSGYTYQSTGMAPGASIVFVKTDWSSNGVIDGINYIFEKAADLGLPAVVNLSLGTQLGAHDGHNPMEEEIDALVAAADGRAVVVAAGNEAGYSIHAEVNASAGLSVIGPEFTVPTYSRKAGAGNDYIYIVGYYPSTDNLTVHLWSPGGEYYSRNLSSLGGTSGCREDLTGADGAVFLCNKTTSVIGDGTGDREIFVQIYDESAGTPPANGTWRFALTGNTVAGAGQVDFWMTSSLGAEVAAFSTHVDNEETLGIPATAAGAITVGAYTTRTCWQDSAGDSWIISAGTLSDIADFSGLGPTRDGRSKPELAAPGLAIISSLAEEVRTDLLAGAPEYVIDDHHLLMAGTSQAAPHVTGAVALLLADDPTLASTAIKSLLSTHARDDDWTNSHNQFFFGFTRNYVFGAGKLDLGTWAWVDPYETNDTLRTARAITSGAALDGYIEHSADIDLFDLEDLTTGDTVNVTLSSLPADYKLTAQRSATLPGDCPETILTTASTSNNAGTANESLTYTAGLSSPARYLRIQSSVGAVSGTDSYTLKAVITRPETTSVHSTRSSAQVLPGHNEFKVSGSAATAAETDYYRLTARSGQTITATAGLLRTTRIYDSTGALVATGGMGMGSATVTVSPFPLGLIHTYYVSVSGFAGSYTLTTTVN
jgi:minor extracellular serine protease Vpr